MSLQERTPNSFVPRIRPDAGRTILTDMIDHIAQLFHDATALIETWQRTSRQRRALSRLDDRMLQDIGLTREQVAREIGRPFWDI
ncbi:MAG: DUF1127 domain-containing protein [Hyphomicrobiaceae bacterium]|nr:DUF1127 domain-containing protein [Hyphomicrobiaceae bacterium]